MEGIPEASDEILFAAWRAGDQTAFETLFRRYQGPLGRHLTRMLGDAAGAEDVIVETFMRLHRHRDRVRPEQALRPLVWTIARNLARNRLRSQRLWGWVPLRAAEPERPVAAPESGEVQRRVKEAFAALPPAQRETASLRVLGELSLEEIADVTGVPLGTVKSRLFHALRRLRVLLADLDPEEG